MMKTCGFMVACLTLVGTTARVLGDLPPLLTESFNEPSIDFVFTPLQSGLSGETPRATVTAPLSTSSPPSLEERKLNYGPLEQKLARQFPSSKVYAMPVVCPLARNSGPIPQGPPAPIDVDPFQFHLRSSEEHLRQAGLTDAANQLQAMHQNYLAHYQGALLIARKETQLKTLQTEVARLKQTADSSAIQVSLRIRLVEFARDTKTRESLHALFFGSSEATSKVASSEVIGSSGSVFESSEINSLLDHLLKTGDAKVISEPQVTVLNGREAHILVGGERADSCVVGVGSSREGSNRSFGTSVYVCPSVTDGRLQLTVNASSAQQETVVQQAGNQPTCSRQVRTTVELREGQTLFLAGLHAQQSRPTQASPTEGKVTAVGSFVDDLAQPRSDDADLVIVITPEIVQPMEPREVPPVPGFEVVRPARLPPAPVPAGE